MPWSDFQGARTKEVGFLVGSQTQISKPHITQLPPGHLPADFPTSRKKRIKMVFIHSVKLGLILGRIIASK